MNRLFQVSGSFYHPSSVLNIYEIDYYRSKITPEERYQTLKETWYFHKTSSYMTGDTSTDRYGCNADVCIPECDFSPDHGRIDVDGNVSH